MYILALDSTSPTASVAVTDNEILMGLYTVNTKNTHSETLLPMVESLLTSLSLNIDDIDLFACAEGPGSFTGVRIGAATIKGLAFAKNKPCVGVSTLHALALNMAATGIASIICPVMNARRNQVYNAIFQSDGATITRLTPDRAISLEDLQAELSACTNLPIYFTGDGCQMSTDAITLSNLQPTPELQKYQNAYQVAVAALTLPQTTDTNLVPTYLRQSQAEREREERT